jgi:hypothetical protein
MRRLAIFVLLALLAGVAAGVALSFALRPQRPAPPPAPIVVEKLREVARLEALEVRVYKKVAYAPEPRSAPTLWGDVFNWAKFTLRNANGRAIVFAVLHLGVDVDQLRADRILAQGRAVRVALPEVKVQVELDPEQTEVIGSNLDSRETAQLFALAKEAFLREASADPMLKAKARRACERAMRAILLSAGFDEVIFVDGLEAPGAG